MKTCVIVASDAERAAAIAATIPKVYDVRPLEQLATADLIVMDVNGEAVWLTRLRPLAAISDATDDAIARYLREHGILDVADLARLNLDELAHAPGVGPRALGRFVRDLSHSGRYPDATRLQEFIVRRGIFV
jgi:hypothetical protein